MSSSFRRYEILLPRQFNDGQPVPDELMVDTALDLRKQFGASHGYVAAGGSGFTGLIDDR